MFIFRPFGRRKRFASDPIAQHNRDAASRLDEVARAFAANEPAPPRNYLEALDRQSDKIERNVVKGYLLDLDDKSGVQRSSRDYAEIAWDRCAGMQEGAELLGAHDVALEFDQMRGEAPEITGYTE